MFLLNLIKSFLNQIWLPSGISYFQKQFSGGVLWKNLAALSKKRLRHKCFPVKLTKILRVPILKNISGRLLVFLTKPESKMSDILHKMHVCNSIKLWLLLHPLPTTSISFSSLLLFRFLFIYYFHIPNQLLYLHSSLRDQSLFRYGNVGVIPVMLYTFATTSLQIM